MSGAPRGLHPLRHAETQIGERVRSVSIHKVVGTSQALYEMIIGAGCPGADRMLFLPHDHVYRGVSIPRNAQMTVDYGNEVTTGNGLSWTVGFSSWYRPHDGGEVVNVNASGVRSTTNPANFRVYVTPGIDTDNTAVSNVSCYLNAEFLVSSDANPVEFRIYNKTIDQVSASSGVVAAYTANLTEIQLKIPCVGGRMNELEIECLAPSGGGSNVTVHQGFIAERRYESQPKTAGTTAYASSTRP